MTKSSMPKCNTLSIATMFIATMGLLSGLTVAAASDICIPPIGGLVSAPTMDGKPQDDVGWNGAGQLGIRDVSQGSNGPSVSSIRSGSVQYGVLNNFLYLSVDLDNGNFSAPGNNDTVVIALSPDGTGADSPNAWRLHIRPGLYSASPPSSLISRPPSTVAYWRNSGSWNLQKPAGQTCSSHQYYDCSSPLVLNIQGIVESSTGSSCNPLESAQFMVSRKGSRWGLEVKIPYSTSTADALTNCKIYLPPANSPFKLYVNVVSTNDFAVSPSYVEDPWPYSVYMSATGFGLIETSTPAPSTWGTASLDTNPPSTTRSVCTGVKIVAAGVKTTATGTLGTTSNAYPGIVDPSGYYYLQDPGNTSSMKLKDANACVANLLNEDQPSKVSQPNTFVAQVTNNGAGTPPVSAKFYIAPWGLPAPGDWDLIGDRYRPATRPLLNPTSPPKTVGAGVVDLATDWKLSYKESCAYALSNVVGFYANKPIGHHCVQAELESTGATVNFISKSLQFNHNVIPASRVEQIAVVGTKGYGPPPQGSSYHEILLNVDQLPRIYGRDGNFYYPRRDDKNMDRSTSPAFSGFGRVSAEQFSKGMTEALTVVTRGYRMTGDKLIIGGSAYQRAQYIGAYSIEAGHNGPVDKWTLALSTSQCPPDSPSEGCISGSGSNYLLRIPKDQAVQVTSTVEAVEPIVPPVCRPTPCTPCPPKTAGSSLLIGMIGIGGAAGISLKPRRRREKNEQDREK